MSRSVVDILGINTPLEVLVISNIALASGAVPDVLIDTCPMRNPERGIKLNRIRKYRFIALLITNANSNN